MSVQLHKSNPFQLFRRLSLNGNFGPFVDDVEIRRHLVRSFHFKTKVNKWLTLRRIRKWICFLKKKNKGNNIHAHFDGTRSTREYSVKRQHPFVEMERVVTLSRS